jgi:ParB-like nuclease domain
LTSSQSLLSQLERVPATRLRCHPDNPRTADMEAIKASLRTNSQFEPLIAQKSTGHVLVGNHRLIAARELGWTTIDVHYVDVDDEQARRIMLASNRTAELGSFDDQALAALLQEIGDLEGTGYTPDDLDDYLAALGLMPELPPTLTNTTWAETPEELQTRLDTYNGSQPRTAFGVREVILILPQDQYEELHRHIQTIRTTSPSELTAGEAVLHGMRTAVTHLP